MTQAPPHPFRQRSAAALRVARLHARRTLALTLILALLAGLAQACVVRWVFAPRIEQAARQRLAGLDRLDRFLDAATTPMTDARLLDLLAEDADEREPARVVIGGWIDDADRSLSPRLELFARRTRALERQRAEGGRAPEWTDEYRRDEPADRDRLARATLAVNAGIDRLDRPAPPGYAPPTPDAPRPQRVAAMLRALLANTADTPAGQMAAVALLHDFGLRVPLERVAELTRAARRERQKLTLIQLIPPAQPGPATRPAPSPEGLAAYAPRGASAQLAALPAVRAAGFTGADIESLAREERDELRLRPIVEAYQRPLPERGLPWLAAGLALLTALAGAIGFPRAFPPSDRLDPAAVTDTMMATGFLGGWLANYLGLALGMLPLPGAMEPWAPRELDDTMLVALVVPILGLTALGFFSGGRWRKKNRPEPLGRRPGD